MIPTLSGGLLLQQCRQSMQGKIKATGVYLGSTVNHNTLYMSHTIFPQSYYSTNTVREAFLMAAVSLWNSTKLCFMLLSDFRGHYLFVQCCQKHLLRTKQHCISLTLIKLHRKYLKVFFQPSLGQNYLVCKHQAIKVYRFCFCCCFKLFLECTQHVCGQRTAPNSYLPPCRLRSGFEIIRLGNDYLYPLKHACHMSETTFSNIIITQYDKATFNVDTQSIFSWTKSVSGSALSQPGGAQYSVCPVEGRDYGCPFVSIVLWSRFC